MDLLAAGLSASRPYETRKIFTASLVTDNAAATSSLDGDTPSFSPALAQTPLGPYPACLPPQRGFGHPVKIAGPFHLTLRGNGN